MPTMNQQQLNQLYNNQWFAHLSSDLQQYITNHSQLLTFEKNQAIFRAGDLFDGIYAVLEGAVRLGYINVQGHEAVSAIAEPIMWFGEISLVDQLPRSHDAICLQPTTVLCLGKEALEKLITHSPIFWKHIAELTSQKLRHAFLELISIQTQTIQQRLAQRLLFIWNGYGNHLNIVQNEIHISQEQLAQMLVSSRQTINQELQILEKLQVIRVAFKKIEILDPQQLQSIAYQNLSSI